MIETARIVSENRVSRQAGSVPRPYLTIPSYLLSIPSHLQVMHPCKPSLTNTHRITTL